MGDELKIILTGNRNESFNLTVGLDGAIFFPNLGSINVFGKNISEISSAIESLVDMSYVGTSVYVGLNNASARKINIIGSIKTPGTYLVNPFTTILSSLAYSGGLEENASLRNIKLIREIRSFHLIFMNF